MFLNILRLSKSVLHTLDDVAVCRARTEEKKRTNEVRERERQKDTRANEKSERKDIKNLRGW
jgi:hypothetical protein